MEYIRTYTHRTLLLLLSAFSSLRHISADNGNSLLALLTVTDLLLRFRILQFLRVFLEERFASRIRLCVSLRDQTTFRRVFRGANEEETRKTRKMRIRNNTSTPSTTDVFSRRFGPLKSAILLLEHISHDWERRKVKPRHYLANLSSVFVLPITRSPSHGVELSKRNNALKNQTKQNQFTSHPENIREILICRINLNHIRKEWSFWKRM